MSACNIIEGGGAKAAFFTLGCRVNQYETRAMEENFASHGFEIIDFGSDEIADGNTCDDDKIADVYVINTCTVTAESDRKCRNVIRRACEKAKRCPNGKGIVLVAGCYAQKDAEKIARIDGVSLVIGNSGKSSLAEKALELLKKQRSAVPSAFDNDYTINAVVEVTDISELRECEKMRITASDRTRAFVKIVDGCENKCSYCIIPSVRGRVRSVPTDDILKEISGLASVGYKEVVLTGIETAAYGTDFEKKRGEALIFLVNEICKIDGIERIRFGSLEPTLISTEFAERLASQKKVMPHFHLSLQSGSSKVLAAMRRKYNAEMFCEKIDILRHFFPNATFTTDIIVGFPGESEEDFYESAKIIEKCRFAYVHIFPYSKRDGTPAAKMSAQLTNSVKKARAAKLHEVMMSVRKDVLSDFIGKSANILFETYNEEKAFGHSEAFIEYETPFIADVTSENRIATVKAVGVSPDGMRIIGELCL